MHSFRNALYIIESNQKIYNNTHILYTVMINNIHNWKQDTICVTGTQTYTDQHNSNAA